MKFGPVNHNAISVILHENLKDDYGFVIGRANKRYTLWKYNKEYKGVNTIIHVAYIQVLSEKLSRVVTRFPGIYICEELRGSTRMAFSTGSSSKKKSLPKHPKTIDDFISLPFGHFKGIPFNEIVDPLYWCALASGDCRWKYGKGDSAVEFDFKGVAERRCKELGCKKIGNSWFTSDYVSKVNVVCWNANCNSDPIIKSGFAEIAKSMGCIQLLGKWYPATPAENEKPWLTTARQILPKIENHEPFNFVAHFNGNEFWFGLPIKFRLEDKEDIYTYYGSSHFLKVTNKKGERVNKRVKGKTIKVSDYELITDNNDEEMYVLVNKFTIV